MEIRYPLLFLAMPFTLEPLNNSQAQRERGLRVSALGVAQFG